MGRDQVGTLSTQNTLPSRDLYKGLHCLWYQKDGMGIKGDDTYKVRNKGMVGREIGTLGTRCTTYKSVEIHLLSDECTCKLSWETSKGGDQVGTHLTHYTLISRGTKYICGSHPLGISWDRVKGVCIHRMRIDGKVGWGDGTLGTPSTTFTSVDTCLMREECNTKLFRETSQGGDKVGTNSTHTTLLSRANNLHYGIIGKQRVMGWEHECFTGGNKSGKRSWMFNRLMVIIYDLGVKSLLRFDWLCVNYTWLGRLNWSQTLLCAWDSTWSAWFSTVSDTAWDGLVGDFGLGTWGMIRIWLTWIIHHQRGQLQSPYNGIPTQVQH
ncbi:hypothetical protein E3N88_21544 [Mikania micrantha]|uniref:Uncharacterized protein n=1 Tax=Mikania micrantha TaxID=192012 RepID=A0A5N6NK37_9ASTR|nr:hypothetical protein E3N88_21544 [Mikania micrantha]